MYSSLEATYSICLLNWSAFFIIKLILLIHVYYIHLNSQLFGTLPFKYQGSHKKNAQCKLEVHVRTKFLNEALHVCLFTQITVPLIQIHVILKFHIANTL